MNPSGLKLEFRRSADPEQRHGLKLRRNFELEPVERRRKDFSLWRSSRPAPPAPPSSSFTQCIYTLATSPRSVPEPRSSVWRSLSDSVLPDLHLAAAQNSGGDEGLCGCSTSTDSSACQKQESFQSDGRRDAIWFVSPEDLGCRG